MFAKNLNIIDLYAVFNRLLPENEIIYEQRSGRWSI